MIRQKMVAIFTGSIDDGRVMNLWAESCGYHVPLIYEFDKVSLRPKSMKWFENHFLKLIRFYGIKNVLVRSIFDLGKDNVVQLQNLNLLKKMDVQIIFADLQYRRAYNSQGHETECFRILQDLLNEMIIPF
jgi:hypothetical protein